MDQWGPVLLAALAAGMGVAGSKINTWVEGRAARKLGLPTNTQTQIIDLREELIAALTLSKDECLRELAKETAKRETLEHIVDEQARQIQRLLQKLPKPRSKS